MKTIATALVLSIALTGPALARGGDRPTSGTQITAEEVSADVAGSSSNGLIIPLILLALIAAAAAAN